MTDSRLIGALFLAGYLVYGVGSILTKSVTGSSTFLSMVAAHQSIVLIGAFLMLLNTGVDVGKGILFFPILENHGKRTALGFLAALVMRRSCPRHPDRYGDSCHIARVTQVIKATAWRSHQYRSVNRCRAHSHSSMSTVA